MFELQTVIFEAPPFVRKRGGGHRLFDSCGRAFHRALFGQPVSLGEFREVALQSARQERGYAIQNREPTAVGTFQNAFNNMIAFAGEHLESEAAWLDTGYSKAI